MRANAQRMQLTATNRSDHNWRVVEYFSANKYRIVRLSQGQLSDIVGCGSLLSDCRVRQSDEFILLSESRIK